MHNSFNSSPNPKFAAISFAASIFVELMIVVDKSVSFYTSLIIAPASYPNVLKYTSFIIFFISAQAYSYVDFIYDI